MVHSALLSQSAHTHARTAIALSNLALVASALVACGNPGDELTLSHAEQPILRGSIDDAHPQVMLLANTVEGFLCTGTVIGVDAATQSAFLPPAGHCASEEPTERTPAGTPLAPLAPDEFVVVPGVDFAESTTQFPVDAVHVEPTYDGSFAADV